MFAARIRKIIIPTRDGFKYCFANYHCDGSYCFLQDEPHENALALVEYLEQEYEGKPYRIIFLGKTSKKIQTHNVKVLYLNPDTLRCKSNLMDILLFGWLYAGSKVLFYENQPLKKWSPKQTLVFLNHGTIPMKDVHDVLGQPKEVDYALCPSKGCADIYGLHKKADLCHAAKGRLPMQEYAQVERAR